LPKVSISPALALFLFISCSTAFAQIDSAIFSIKASLHKGFIIPHSDSLKKAADGAYPFMMELDASWLDYSQKGWGSANCYRNSGLILGYVDFGNPEVLGQGSYFMLYTEPQLTFSKLSFSFTGAAGIIYLNTVYDREENPTNLFYSNPFSGLIRAGFTGTYTPKEHLQFSLSANFNHISNGRTRIPNYGMNFPTAALSVIYRFQQTTLQAQARIKTFDPILHYAVNIFTAHRLVNAAYESFGKERMLGINFSVSRHFNHCSSWVAGTEVSYDKSIPETGAQFGYDSSPWIASLIGGHSLSLGRTSFSQLLGVYMYKDYDNSHAIFQRYILDYGLTKKLRVGFSLKAHLEVAEMLDARLGITF
jgi:hypothetical protein